MPKINWIFLKTLKQNIYKTKQKMISKPLKIKLEILNFVLLKCPLDIEYPSVPISKDIHSNIKTIGIWMIII